MKYFIKVVLFFKLTANGWQLQEVGDFGDENCLPALHLIRSTKLHLTTEPPISCRCCYRAFFFVLRSFAFKVCPNVIKFLNFFFAKILVPKSTVIHISHTLAKFQILRLRYFVFS